ncbi:MAG TPA: hypothetical protein PKA27_05425 [Fimbriimonadaceae bacterium]|nr:hypothetical protein [Fimbriimonadaceae bacterium]
MVKKTAKEVKNSLKFKVAPKKGLLTVRVGVKKYTLPVEARLIAGEGHLFLSFSASSELYEIVDGKLSAMEGGADASKAFATLNPPKGRSASRRRRSAPEMPNELAEALNKIPAGHKLVLDAKTGQWRLAKKRNRKKKA